MHHACLIHKLSGKGGVPGAETASRECKQTAECQQKAQSALKIYFISIVKKKVNSLHTCYNNGGSLIHWL